MVQEIAPTRCLSSDIVPSVGDLVDNLVRTDSSSAHRGMSFGSTEL
jgi:hypothetical protein